MRSTDKLIEKAQDNMRIASDSDNSLDQTVYYSNQAVVMMLGAVVVELQNLREAIESKS